MEQNRDHYAILIGIDNYSQLPALKTAVTGATEFAGWLTADKGGALPRENVKLILSNPGPVENPLDAVPNKWMVDRAFISMGIQSSLRIGKRLYIYFSGHGVVEPGGDVGLLMADASQQRLSSIGLESYRNFFRASKLFDEVVYILDLYPNYVSGFDAPGLNFMLQAEGGDRAFSESLLIGAGYEVVVEDMSEWRGLLTMAVLEGLRGAAVNPAGRITSLTLAEYVKHRMVELAAQMNLPPKPPVYEQLGKEIVFQEEAAEPGSRSLSLKSLLVVEVPHWTTEVQIYDSLMRPVADVGPVKEEGDKYSSSTVLPPGVYQVEASLEGTSEQQLVSVPTYKPGRIDSKSWKLLKFSAAAPFAGTATSSDLQTERAIEWSRKTTWERPAGGGNSRLFLFVRALKPQKHLDEGLSLLDVNGNLITDFSDGVKRNINEGWMAFNADLAPGFYIIRRGRSGVRVRCQPLFLCAGWETQVFLAAHRTPSLRTMTLNLAPYNEGFNPKDDAAIAAEAVLSSLWLGGPGKFVFTSEKIITLLGHEYTNPWLGILAAYALLPPQQGSTRQADLYSDSEQFDCFLQVIGFLNQTLSAHPDVRALNLAENLPEGFSRLEVEPFPYPPLLGAGLKLVQQYALRNTGIIPMQSLTDCLLTSVVINSPWTAWRHLDKMPLGWKGESSHAGIDDKPSRKRKEAAPPTVKTYTRAFIDSASRRAPVFRIPQLDDEREIMKDPARVVSASAAPATVATFLQAPIISKVQELIAERDLDTLPETVLLNRSTALNELLRQVEPEAVSKASGLPLTHIETGLSYLIANSDSSAFEDKDRLGDQLSRAEQSILEYAMQKNAANKSLPRNWAADESDESLSIQPLDDAMAVNTMQVTIEEIASKLQAEAERLLLNPKNVSRMQNVSERLRQLADELMKKATFIVISNPKGIMRYGNSAFLKLLSYPKRKQSGGTSQPKLRPTLRKKFETALKKAPLGTSAISGPGLDSATQEWVLQRTEIIDEKDSQPLAYLNVLRIAHQIRVPETVMHELDSLIPDLSLNATLYAHSDSKDQSQYADTVESLTAELESIIRNSAVA